MSFEQLQAGLADFRRLLGGIRLPDGECWIVGGTLRDAWLGRPLHDIDLVVPEPLEPLLAALEELSGNRAYTVNSRFASQRIVLEGVDVDVTALNGADIEADLRRRDYCINAMALPLAPVLAGTASLDDLVCDPLAVEDLEARRLRLVSAAALPEDPLRVLRGFRLAAQFGFEPDSACHDAWKLHAPELRRVSGERQREELLRWFGLPHFDTTLMKICADSGVLWQLFPELEDSVGCTQNEFHHLDVWLHTLLALRQLDVLLEDLPPELQSFEEALRLSLERRLEGGASVLALTRIALLLHDVAKPATRRVEEDGHISFIGHQQVGVELVLPELERLRFSVAEREFLATMIREHLRLGFYCKELPLPAKLVYRYIRSLGEACLPMLLHSIADCMAARGPAGQDKLPEHITAAAQIADNLVNDSTVARPPVLLDGNEIMVLLGLREGPQVGRYKRALLEATAEGWVSTPDEAREFLAGLAGKPLAEAPED